MSAPVVNKDGLLAVIQPLTQLSPAAVFWDLTGRRQMNGVDFAQVRLRLRGPKTRGVDLHLHTYDAGSDTLSTAELGQRDVRLTLIAECGSAVIEASEILENVRTGIFSEASVAALQAIGLALQTYSQVVEVPTTYDEEVISAATLDVFFGGFKLTDAIGPAPGAGGDYIATVSPIQPVLTP